MADLLEESRARTAMRRSLRRWYDRHGRDLPWRRNRSLYRVWVSEIMLQQTQAATVIPYYRRFLDAFPSVRALARAPEQEVLRLWEGLGYYRRARNLHRAARQVAEAFGGRIPRDVEQLQQLAGIGRYTAHAILSFALDRRLPILEANTRRLYRRLSGPASEWGDRELWAFAERLLPRDRVADWNNALIDVGSLVCTPKAPRCWECPLQRWCAAFASGETETTEGREERPTATPLQAVAVVLEDGGRWALRQCGEGEWWTGLWDFVRVHLEMARDEPPTRTEVRALVQRETGIEVGICEPLSVIRHSVTRYRIRLDCFRASPADSRRAQPKNGYRWCERSEVETLPLTATARKLARLAMRRCLREGHAGCRS